MVELGLAVIRFDGGGGGGDYRHYLSVLCPQDFSVAENLKLPFDTNDSVEGSSGGGGLLSFYNIQAKIVTCNLTTKEMKELPLPEFKSTPNSVILNGCGLACDGKSGDYKVIRSFYRYYYDEDVKQRGDDSTYSGFEKCTQLYSSKSGVWKDIGSLECGDITNCAGVYVRDTRCCYWTTIIKLSGGQRAVGVVSFDFATERFGCLSLPDESIYNLVEYCGSLGAVSQLETRKPYSSDSYFELSVWRNNMWVKLHHVSLARVGSPLYFKDDCLVFLEEKCKCSRKQQQKPRGQLVLYDLGKKETIKLNIYDGLETMRVYSYVETTNPLPDSGPMTRENGEERKTGIGSDETETETTIERMTMRRKGKGKGKGKGMGMKMQMLNLKMKMKMK